MSEAAVLIEYREQIAIVTMNRPQAYNALGTDVRAGLQNALNELRTRADIRVVILTAIGKGFCAGADLREGFPQSVSGQLHDEFEPLLMGLRRLDKVVIAAVNGATAGIGCALLGAADLAVMAEDAYLQLAFSKIALVPDGGVSWLLVNALGYKRAYRLMIESGRIDAQQCVEYGLVNEVVSAADLQARTLAWAQEICARSPVANVLTKRVLHRAEELTIQGAFAVEAELQDIASRSADSAEGVRAFLEKRAPKYPGH